MATRIADGESSLLECPELYGTPLPLVAVAGDETVRTRIRDGLKRQWELASTEAPNVALRKRRILDMSLEDLIERFDRKLAKLQNRMQEMNKGDTTAKKECVLKRIWLTRFRTERPCAIFLAFDCQSSETLDHDVTLVAHKLNAFLGRMRMWQQFQLPKPRIGLYLVLPSQTIDPQSRFSSLGALSCEDVAAIFMTCGIGDLPSRLDKLEEIVLEGEKSYYYEFARYLSRKETGVGAQYVAAPRGAPRVVSQQSPMLLRVRQSLKLAYVAELKTDARAAAEEYIEAWEALARGDSIADTYERVQLTTWVSARLFALYTNANEPAKATHHMQLQRGLVRQFFDNTEGGGGGLLADVTVAIGLAVVHRSLAEVSPVRHFRAASQHLACARQFAKAAGILTKTPGNTGIASGGSAVVPSVWFCCPPFLQHDGRIGVTSCSPAEMMVAASDAITTALRSTIVESRGRALAMLSVAEMLYDHGLQPECLALAMMIFDAAIGPPVSLAEALGHHHHGDPDSENSGGVSQLKKLRGWTRVQQTASTMLLLSVLRTIPNTTVAPPDAILFLAKRSTVAACLAKDRPKTTIDLNSIRAVLTEEGIRFDARRADEVECFAVLKGGFALLDAFLSDETSMRQKQIIDFVRLLSGVQAPPPDLRSSFTVIECEGLNIAFLLTDVVATPTETPPEGQLSFTLTATLVVRNRYKVGIPVQGVVINLSVGNFQFEAADLMLWEEDQADSTNTPQALKTAAFKFSPGKISVIRIKGVSGQMPHGEREIQVHDVGFRMSGSPPMSASFGSRTLYPIPEPITITQLPSTATTTDTSSLTRERTHQHSLFYLPLARPPSPSVGQKGGRSGRSTLLDKRIFESEKHRLKWPLVVSLPNDVAAGNLRNWLRFGVKCFESVAPGELLPVSLKITLDPMKAKDMTFKLRPLAVHVPLASASSSDSPTFHATSTTSLMADGEVRFAVFRQHMPSSLESESLQVSLNFLSDFDSSSPIVFHTPLGTSPSTLTRMDFPDAQIPLPVTCESDTIKSVDIENLVLSPDGTFDPTPSNELTFSPDPFRCRTADTSKAPFLFCSITRCRPNEVQIETLVFACLPEAWLGRKMKLVFQLEVWENDVEGKERFRGRIDASQDVQIAHHFSLNFRSNPAPSSVHQVSSPLLRIRLQNLTTHAFTIWGIHSGDSAEPSRGAGGSVSHHRPTPEMVIIAQGEQWQDYIEIPQHPQPLSDFRLVFSRCPGDLRFPLNLKTPCWNQTSMPIRIDEFEAEILRTPLPLALHPIAEQSPMVGVPFSWLLEIKNNTSTSAHVDLALSEKPLAPCLSVLRTEVESLFNFAKKDHRLETSEIPDFFIGGPRRIREVFVPPEGSIKLAWTVIATSF